MTPQDSTADKSTAPEPAATPTTEEKPSTLGAPGSPTTNLDNTPAEATQPAHDPRHQRTHGAPRPTQTISRSCAPTRFSKVRRNVSCAARKTSLAALARPVQQVALFYSAPVVCHCADPVGAECKKKSQVCLRVSVTTIGTDFPSVAVRGICPMNRSGPCVAIVDEHGVVLSGGRPWTPHRRRNASSRASDGNTRKR